VVRENISNSKREVRYRLGGVEQNLLKLSCNDFAFLAEEIQTQKAEDYRNQMEMQSFNAWQQLSFKGVLKKGTSFERYKKQLGLGSVKTTKIDKREKEEVLKTASLIHERIQREQNGKQKNI